MITDAPLTTKSALIDELAPEAQKLMQQHRVEFQAKAGNLVERTGFHMVFPMLVREVPTGMELAFELLMKKFGQMNLYDVMKFLEQFIGKK